MAFRIYQALTFLLWPLMHVLLWRRLRLGKENAFRVRERRGIASVPRPAGQVVWFHGASVGETLSILPLAKQVLNAFPGVELLVTSGTLASAELLASRLPERARHQFLPMDHPFWVARFLDTWQPAAAVWAESELWPNLVTSCAARDIPLMLANARLSQTSHRRWMRRSRLAQRLFKAFDPIITQTEADRERFESLGAENTVLGGNIKFAGQPLPANETDVSAWRAAFADRPVWMAASTHPGEEELVLEAHNRLQDSHPGLLTILVPRHLDRLADMQENLLKDQPHALFTEGPDAVAPHAILLVDKMGVLGPLYQSCPITLVAGSLVPHIGGHNPIEPARNGSSVIVGTHMESQADVVQMFLAADGLVQISEQGSLADVVDSLLSDHERVDELRDHGQKLVTSQAGVLRLYSSAIFPRLEDALGL